ncbi:MAG: twin-arginine translocation signal domain-containing protein, partial [Deltaproteobacteria bacterium]
MNRRKVLGLLGAAGAAGALGGLYYEFVARRGKGGLQAPWRNTAEKVPASFVDVTRESGILFEHNNGAFGKK